MKRYIIKLTPKDFYYEEMNYAKLFDGDCTHFAIPVGDYVVGDLITFDYGNVRQCGFDKDGKERVFAISHTYKIVEIVLPKEKDFFMLAENNLRAVKTQYHDYTRDSEEVRAATEVIELT